MTTKRKNPPKRRTLEEQIKYDEQKLAQAEEAAAKAKENIRRRKAAMKKKRLETLGRFTEYVFQKSFKYAYMQEKEISEDEMLKYMTHFFKKEFENVSSDEKSDIKAQNWSNYVLPQIELIAEEEARKYEKAQKAQAQQPKPQPQGQAQQNHAPQQKGA